jgi:ACS family pantothenate transporter-like MFS transporter
MAFVWGSLSDGPLKGARWPFIYAGAVITLIFSILMRQMPLYENIYGRKVVYWLSQIGVSVPPLIQLYLSMNEPPLLTWFIDWCRSTDSELD